MGTLIIKSCIIAGALTLGMVKGVNAQDTSDQSGNTTFLMRGYSHAGFEVIDGKPSFVSGTFAPIFLWKQSDNIFFEAEAEIVYTNTGIDFGLEYANISYILNDYLVFRFGNFLTPFGIFGERLHPNWINPFPTNPLGFDHHNPVGPFAEFGVELRGGASLGQGNINYAVYVSNGPQLNVNTTADPIEVNTSYRNIQDNNNNKAVGGRVGILPFSSSFLEIGLSSQFAKIGDRDTQFEEIGSNMYAVDLTLVKGSISPIGGDIDLKGQWNYVDEDKFEYITTAGEVSEIDNDKSAYFATISYRPSLADSDFLGNLELTSRYSALDIINEEAAVGGGDGHDHAHNGAAAAEGDGPVDQSQWAFGVNYWLTWRSVLKFSYQKTDTEEPGIYLHYALGF